MQPGQPDPGQALRAFAESSAPAQFEGALIYVKSVSGSPELYRLLPTSTLSQRFLELDLAQATELSQRSVIGYAPGRLVPDGHLMHTPAAAVSLLTTLALDTISGRTIETFNPREHVTDRPRMTITIATRDDLRCVFFRYMRPTARLTRSRQIAALFRGPVFDLLDDEIFLFSEAVDAITAGGEVYLTNRHNFDQYFEYRESMQQQATEIFDRITKGLAIDGIDSLRAAATRDPNMAVKLSSIQRKIDLRPEYSTALQMGRLLDFIDTHPRVDIDLAGHGAQRRLVFRPSAQRRWKILKLLDDDYLKSDLTTMDYEVDSKGDPLG